MYVWMISFPQWFLFAMFCGIFQHILNSPNSTPLSFFCKSPLEAFGNKVTNRRPQSSGGLGQWRSWEFVGCFKQLQPMLHFHTIPKFRKKKRNACCEHFPIPPTESSPITLIFFWHISIPAAFNVLYPRALGCGSSDSGGSCFHVES